MTRKTGLLVKEILASESGEENHRALENRLT